MMQKICRLVYLGQVPYQTVWDYQNLLAEKIADGQMEETLLLLEHPHTFTIGRRGSIEHLLWSKEELTAKGVELLRVDRGGDITYHGPGQLVGYPLLRLAPIGWQGDRLPEADYVGYIRKLEEVLIRVLKTYDILGFRVPGKTGVWVRGNQDDLVLKIASIGVKVDVKGVTHHGFALNVNPEMDYWQGIVPCGLPEVVMTSMAKYLTLPLDVAQVTGVVADCFGCVFDRNMVED